MRNFLINVREMRWSGVKVRNIIRVDNPHVALKWLENAVKSRIPVSIEESSKAGKF